MKRVELFVDICDGSLPYRMNIVTAGACSKSKTEDYDRLSNLLQSDRAKVVALTLSLAPSCPCDRMP